MCFKYIHHDDAVVLCIRTRAGADFKTGALKFNVWSLKFSNKFEKELLDRLDHLRFVHVAQDFSPDAAD